MITLFQYIASISLLIIFISIYRLIKENETIQIENIQYQNIITKQREDIECLQKVIIKKQEHIKVLTAKIEILQK